MVKTVVNLNKTCHVSFADYVFFENSSSNPYLIRRIEELNKVQHFCRVGMCCMKTTVEENTATLHIMLSSCYYYYNIFDECLKTL